MSASETFENLPHVPLIMKDGSGKLSSQVIFSYHKLSIIIVITLNYT